MSDRAIPRSLPFFAVHLSLFQKSVYSISYPSSKYFARIGLALFFVLKDLLWEPIRLFQSCPIFPALLQSICFSFAFSPKINLSSLPAGDNSFQEYFFFVFNVRDKVCIVIDSDHHYPLP